MLLYMLLLLFLLLGVLQDNNNSAIVIRGVSKTRKLYIFTALSFLLLLFFYAVRGDSVGWDTNNYFFYFNHLDTFVYTGFLEYGWVFILNRIHSITSNHIFYQFVIGSIGIGTFFYAAKKLSYNMAFSIVIYFMQGMWFNLMNQQRNAIASCICMISFCFLVKKRYIPALLANIIAYLIHDSALVFLIFIIFNYLLKKRRKTAYIIFGAGALFVTVFYRPIYTILVKRFYPSYTTELQLIRETEGGNLKMMVFYVAVIAVVYYIDRRTVEIQESENKNIETFSLYNFMERDREKFLLYMALCFSIFFQFISINNTMIARFSNYFSVYLTILIPNVLSKIKSHRNKLQYTIIILMIYFAYMMIYLKFSENGFGRDKVIPYVFIW